MKTSALFSKLFITVAISFLFLSNSGIVYCDDPDCPANQLLLLRLDETSGPTYADYYGVNIAVASNSPTAVTGIVHGAQLFDNDTYVNIPDNRNDFEWGAGCSFSLEFWIKTPTHEVPQVGISRQTAGSICWWLGINEYGGAVMEIQDSQGNNYAVYNKDFSISYTDNQWHHIVGVKDGTTNYMALYVDGELIEGKTAGFYGNFYAPSSTDVSVGYMLRADGSSFEYHVNGALDEVAVYTRALTADEIVSFYNSGTPRRHCNSAPVFTSIPITTATEDVVYSYTLTTDDSDTGDELTLSAVTKPSWLNFAWTPGQKSAVLSGIPTNDNVVSNSFALRINDCYTTTDQSFTIDAANVNDVPVIVSVNPVNDAPEITSDPESTAIVSDPYMYQMTATDVDESDVHTLTAPNKPNWLSFIPASNSGILMGIPVTSDMGTSAIILKVSDGYTDVLQVFSITVTNPSGICDVNTDMICEVYPNPVSNMINFKFSLSDRNRIEIYDITGNLLMVKDSDNTDLVEMNISDLLNGVYFYKAFQNNKVNSGKIAKN
jgi:hypothetical protein